MPSRRPMKPANVQEVKDTLSLKDDTVEINLYNIPNPHVDGILLVHVVKENIVWVTDLVSPRGTDRPQSRHGRGRRRAEEAQHHRRNDRRRPWRDRQAGRHRPRAGGELTNCRDRTRGVWPNGRTSRLFCPIERAWTEWFHGGGGGGSRAPDSEYRSRMPISSARTRFRMLFVGDTPKCPGATIN